MFKVAFSKKLTSDSLWSLAGNGVSVVAGLATVKIIATWVDTSAYGQASLILGIVALLNGLLVGPLMVVHLRLYFDYIKRELGRWYATVFNGIFFAVAALAAVFYLIIAIISIWNGQDHYWKHAAPVIALILLQPYVSALSNYLEAHREQRRLATLNVLQRGLAPCFLLPLLLVTSSPTDALVAAQGLTALFLLAVFRVPNAQRASASVPVQRSTELLALRSSVREFGWELPLSYLVMWLITTQDRYFLQHFATVTDVGLYAMNYGFWSMPFLFLNGWLEVLTRPIIYDHAAKGSWARVRKVLLLRALIGVVVSVAGTLLLYFLAEPIGKLMLGEQYWVDRQLVMVIAFAHCFYVLGYSVMPVFLAAKRTRWILVATASAALCNFITNLVFIPALGIFGAAITTLIAYILWAVMLASAGYYFMRTLVDLEH